MWPSAKILNACCLLMTTLFSHRDKAELYQNVTWRHLVQVLEDTFTDSQKHTLLFCVGLSLLHMVLNPSLTFLVLSVRCR